MNILERYEFGYILCDGKYLSFEEFSKINNVWPPTSDTIRRRCVWDRIFNVEKQVYGMPYGCGVDMFNFEEKSYVELINSYLIEK